CGELHAIALRECTLCFSVERHALQSARIVANLLAGVALDGQQILLRVDTFDSCIFSCFDALSLAAFCVAYDVARFIPLSPLTVCTGDFLARDQNSHISLPVAHLASLLH